MVQFPSNITYILVPGRTNMLPRKQVFLGGRTLLVEKPTAEIEVLFFTKEDGPEFLRWFAQDLGYGTEQFEISLPFFGESRIWTASIASESISEVPDAVVSSVKLKLELHDDMDLVAAYYAEGWTGRLSNTLFDLDLASSFDLRTGTGPVTYDQPSEVNYTDAYGNTATAAPDEGAFNNGLRCNVASTNEIIQSEDLTDAAYLGTAATATTIGASGLTLNLLTDDDTGGFKSTYQNITIPDDDATHTISIALKQHMTDDLAHFRVNLLGGTTTIADSFYFDFDTGTVGTVGTVTATEILGVESLSDGVYIVCMRVTNNSSGNTVLRVNLYPATLANGALVGSVYSGRWQVELNKEFCTDYMRTTTAAESRLAQTLSVQADGNIPDLAKGATLRWQGAVDKFANGLSQQLLSVYANADEWIRLTVGTTGAITMYHESAGITEYAAISYSSAGLSDGDEIVVWVTFAGTGMTMYIGTAENSTSFAMTTPDIASSDMTFGSTSTSNHASDLQGKEGRITWWPFVLTADEMERAS